MGIWVRIFPLLYFVGIVHVYWCLSEVYLLPGTHYGLFIIYTGGLGPGEGLACLLFAMILVWFECYLDFWSCFFFLLFFVSAVCVPLSGLNFFPLFEM